MDDVRLRRVAVAHVRHVSDVDGGALDDLERPVVEALGEEVLALLGRVVEAPGGDRTPTRAFLVHLADFGVCGVRHELSFRGQTGLWQSSRGISETRSPAPKMVILRFVKS